MEHPPSNRSFSMKSRGFPNIYIYIYRSASGAFNILITCAKNIKKHAHAYNMFARESPCVSDLASCWLLSVKILGTNDGTFTPISFSVWEMSFPSARGPCLYRPPIFPEWFNVYHFESSSRIIVFHRYVYIYISLYFPENNLFSCIYNSIKSFYSC